MVITEIFKSIQGEGTRAGLPCIFVRLTGCNLRCTWCDTAYAFHGGRKMSVEEILTCVNELAGSKADSPASQVAVSLVELTGGEPLLQEEVYPLAEKLLAQGYTVMIETSGERFIGKLPGAVIKIVDVKCPDSGEPHTFEMRNLDALSENDEVKFVLSTKRDYEFARDFTARHWSRARWWSGFWRMVCRCGSGCNCTNSFGTRRPRASDQRGRREERRDSTETLCVPRFRGEVKKNFRNPELAKD
jgi:7-carboxy-7-deazaguanine synthase